MDTNTRDISAYQCNQWAIMSHGCAQMDTNTRNISAYQCNQWAIMSHRPAQMDTDTWNISVDQCNQWENWCPTDAHGLTRIHGISVWISAISGRIDVPRMCTDWHWNSGYMSSTPIVALKNRTKMRFFLHICKKMCTFARWKGGGYASPAASVQQNPIMT